MGIYSELGLKNVSIHAANPWTLFQIDRLGYDGLSRASPTGAKELRFIIRVLLDRIEIISVVIHFYKKII